MKRAGEESLIPVAAMVLCVLMCSSAALAQQVVLDDFENLAGWNLIVIEGVQAHLASAPGRTGKALELSFEFQAGSGYAIAQKHFDLTLPENYKFTFSLRGETPSNNFEFKLLDAQENVYWIKQLNVDYPAEWKKRTVKKRHISFAWGLAGGGMPKRIDRIEFVVSAGTGGKGRIYVDDFRFEPIDDTVQASRPPEVKSSSQQKDHAPQISPAGSVITNWASVVAAPGRRQENTEWLMVNFQKEREIGGLVIDWDQENFATDYEVELSDDGKEWMLAHAVHDGNGGRDYVYMPETEASYLRLQCRKSSAHHGYAISRLEVMPADFATSPNAFFSAIAAQSPPGHFPQYFQPRQTYWTVVGVSGDTREALLNENGALEVDKACFSLEPFLFCEGHLVSWHEAVRQQTLAEGYLPIPSVRWEYQNLILTITACAAGDPGKSSVLNQYYLENNSNSPVTGKLFIALRPFQVLPPWQELNLIGGVAHMDSVRYTNHVVFVNHDKRVVPLRAPDDFGAATFDQGDITEYLQKGALPRQSRAVDALGYASAALVFSFELQPHASDRIVLAVPFQQEAPVPSDEAEADAWRRETQRFWETKLGQVDIRLPAAAQDLVNTFKSQLAYILINRDGPAIQPGSRTYERAWMRDGALTSAALLQTGNNAEVRAYLDWYVPHQYPSGKVPCVVDSRGADPVAENDSHGEMIYAIMEYFRFSRDTTWLREKFPAVEKAVHYIQELRRLRMTEAYRSGTPEQRACYGLVPESISHEGYSAKPMHSYWDDFFILRGLKDAAAIAEVLGEHAREREFAAERDDFRNSLYASLRLAMSNQHIDFIPGCVELGDFDATSTTIGVYPGNELGNIPEPQLHNTFDQYFEYFKQRQQNAIDWINYTPYEARVIGTFILLDDKTRAHAVLDYLMKDRRPAGWNHWAEVVWRDPSTPKMIGDMPHTWVGSDFMRSFRTMFVYERERDQALVIGAGIQEDWVRGPGGVAVKQLPTYYGAFNFSMKADGGEVLVDLNGEMKMPPGKIELRSPFATALKHVAVEGKESMSFDAGRVYLNTFPARVVLSYD